MSLALALRVSYQLWIRPPLRVWSRSSNFERRRTLLVWTTQKAVRRHAVTQVAQAVREVKASASQRAGACEYLGPMDRLDVEPPDADQQELWRANYAKLKGGSPREGSACTMEQLAAVHARLVTFRHEPYVDFAQLTPNGPRVQKVLCFQALHNLADGAVSLELLPCLPDCDTWSLVGACTASFCILLDFSKETRPRDVKRFWLCHISSVGELPGSLQ